MTLRVAKVLNLIHSDNVLQQLSVTIIRKKVLRQNHIIQNKFRFNFRNSRDLINNPSENIAYNTKKLYVRVLSNIFGYRSGLVTYKVELEGHQIPQFGRKN